jgi:hypothetical protein
MLTDRFLERVSRPCTWLLGAALAWLSVALPVKLGETGRPFRTEDNATVPRGSFELEAAADLAFERADRAIVVPLLSLKAGVADRVELGLEGGYQFVRSEGRSEAGFTDTTFKVKVRFYDGFAALPSLGATFGTILPTADRDIAPSRDVGFLAIAQVSADLEAFVYYLNVGVTLAEDPQERRNRLDENLLWGLAFEIPVREEVALAVDFFGATQQGGGALQSALFGGIWRSPWEVDFDFALIVGLTRSADDVGLTFGLTYRFPVFGSREGSQALRRPPSAGRKRPYEAVSRTDDARAAWGRPLRRLSSR